MRHRLRPLLILFSAAWLLMGCGQKPPPPAPKPPPVSYALEVRGENGTSQEPVFDNTETTVGAFHVNIQGGQLAVNKRSYGTIKAGDKMLIQWDGQVLVKWSGQVLVNAIVREPWNKHTP